MLDFPRWKVWSISLVILIGILFAIPSMLPADLKARYPTWLPSATINLGLDLAGGSQLLLEADQAGRRQAAPPGDGGPGRDRASPQSARRDRRRFDGRRPRLLHRPRPDPGRYRGGAACGRSPSRSRLTGTRDWDVQVVDSTRIVLTPTQGGVAARAARRDDRRPRRRPPPYRPAGHEGNHRHQPGRPTGSWSQVPGRRRSRRR